MKTIPKHRTYARTTGKTPDARVAAVVAGRWRVLQGELLHNGKRCYQGVSAHDILVTAFEAVIREETLRNATESEIIEHFKRAFAVIKRQTQLDTMHVAKYMYNHADDIQT